jgi:hypothetical protein
LITSTDVKNKHKGKAAPHGPYKLAGITAGGLAILEGREDERIPLRHLTVAPENFLPGTKIRLTEPRWK